MKRKQKILRNFSLAALLIFAWWFLLGARPLTVKQAVTWEARRWGLAGDMEVLREETQKLYRDTVYRGDSHVGLSRLEKSLCGYTVRTYDVQPQKKVNFLWLQMYGFYTGEIPVLCLVSEAENAVTAEVQLHVQARTVLPYDQIAEEVLWDEIYTASAELENGAGWLRFSEKTPGGAAETQVMYSLCEALGGYKPDDVSVRLTAILRDASGKKIDTYREIVLDNYKEETP